jgi:translation initiation factor IF-2
VTTMNTVRVYDLATKFRLTTKEVLDRLQAAGVEASTFSSTVEEHVALEILSKPIAKIPAQTIRPGAAAPAKPKPATRRTAKAKAAPAAADEGAAPAKPRARAKKAAAPAAAEAKGEAKPRTRKVAAAARVAASKPLVVTLEAPTLEHQAPAPPAEIPVPVPAPPIEAPVVVEAPAAPPIEAPVAPPVAAAPVAPAEPPRAVEAPAPPVPAEPPVGPAAPAEPPPAPAAAPWLRPPSPAAPAPHRREAARPVARPPRPEPVKEAKPRPGGAEAPPRPAVDPPRPVVAEAAPPDARALEAPPAPAYVPPAEPVIAPPRERRAPGREAPPRAARVEPAAPPPPAAPPVVKVLKVGEGMTPKELAEKMSATVSDVIKRLIKLGILATINTSIDAETVTKVAQQFGYTVERASPEDLVEEVTEVEDRALLKPRAPVVTVMGHVDHGKTSLLDAIRHTNVTASEAGGITQHIGAYEVEVPGHAVSRVVFLDTPGHAAFTAMRARGAQATDIVVLVVAADDGVMPQTIEAINHAKAAKVPMLVAVNKIDKPNADPNRIKQQLTEYGLVPEEWGGDTIFVPVSAKRREGIENLLDNLLVLAEVQEFKANPAKPARGVVIEAELDKGRGPVATVLVQSGSLRVGDAVVAGLHHGRIRAMINDRGKKLQEAGPATPVEVLGLSGVPLAGDAFAAVGDERKARQIALARQEKHRQEVVVTQPRMTLDALHQQIQQGEVKELRLILKGDVQGSVEPLRESLERLATEQVTVKVIHTSVGAITESDVMLAAASNAIVVGFNVRPDPKAQRLAEQERVDLRLYTVIYDAVNQIKAAMEGLLEPTYVERQLGRVEVRQLFNISKVGTVAGSFVVDGKVVQNARVRVVRDGKVVHEGKVGSLRRFKQDASEVLSGQECGIGLANYNDVHPGDVLEVFEMEEVAPKL